MANTVEYGLENVHYATYTVDPSGLYVYDAPKPIKGAVTLTMEPSGSESSFYADNGIYFATTSNTGYTGTLTIAKLTEEFRTDVLGDKLVAGGLMEASNARTKDIALMFRISGDVQEDDVVYYDVTVARPNQNANTTSDTIEVGTQELTLTAKPRKSDRVIRYTTGEATPPVVKDAFYTTVQTPEILSAIV